MRLLKASEITNIPHFTDNVLDAIQTFRLRPFGTIHSEAEGKDYEAGVGLPEYVNTIFTANKKSIQNLSEEGKIFVDNQGNPLKITLSDDDLNKVINICKECFEDRVPYALYEDDDIYEHGERGDSVIDDYIDDIEDIDYDEDDPYDEYDDEDDFAYAWLEDDDDEDDDDELLNEWFRKQEQKRR